MKNNSGYIALVSIISLSIVISLIVFTLNMKGFFSRFNILDSEFKETSLTYATSCRNIAIYKLKANNEYVPKSAGETVLISPLSEGETCLIKGVEREDDSWTIQTVGIKEKAHTNLRTIVEKSGDNLSIVSSKEVSSFE